MVVCVLLKVVLIINLHIFNNFFILSNSTPKSTQNHVIGKNEMTQLRKLQRTASDDLTQHKLLSLAPCSIFCLNELREINFMNG